MSALRQQITQDVALDGAVFENVDFENCRLIYQGGKPPRFDNCRFDNTNFVFEGSAANTLGFLRAMAPEKTNMRDVVLALLPELQA